MEPKFSDEQQICGLSPSIKARSKLFSVAYLNAGIGGGDIWVEQQVLKRTCNFAFYL